jgi:hypothetical protein
MLTLLEGYDTQPRRGRPGPGFLSTPDICRAYVYPLALLNLEANFTTTVSRATSLEGLRVVSIPDNDLGCPSDELNDFYNSFMG